MNDLFFKTKRLTNDNQLIGVSGVPNTLAPGASFTVSFQIGLRERKPFTFLTDAYGVPDDPRATNAALTAPSFTYTATAAALQVAPLRQTIYLPLIAR